MVLFSIFLPLFRSLFAKHIRQKWLYQYSYGAYYTVLIISVDTPYTLAELKKPSKALTRPDAVLHSGSNPAYASSPLPMHSK